MSRLEEILLDQEIICKALSLLETLCEEPNELLNKKELEILPKLRERELKKMAMLEARIENDK